MMTALYPSEAHALLTTTHRRICEDIAHLPHGLRGLDTLSADTIHDFCDRLRIPYHGRADGIARIRRKVRGWLSLLAHLNDGRD